MTLRGTLALLGVLALLVVYLTAIDRPERAPVEEPLLTVTPARATEVDIAWPDGRLLTARRDGEWRDANQRPLPAGLIDDLLVALRTMRALETLSPDGAQPTEYGFGAAATSLAVAAEKQPVLRLEVGARNPAWTGVYVRRRGSSEVLLVGALLHWELEKLHAAAMNTPG